MRPTIRLGPGPARAAPLRIHAEQGHRKAGVHRAAVSPTRQDVLDCAPVESGLAVRCAVMLVDQSRPGPSAVKLTRTTNHVGSRSRRHRPAYPSDTASAKTSSLQRRATPKVRRATETSGSPDAESAAPSAQPQWKSPLVLVGLSGASPLPGQFPRPLPSESNTPVGTSGDTMPSLWTCGRCRARGLDGSTTHGSDSTLELNRSIRPRARERSSRMHLNR